MAGYVITVLSSIMSFETIAAKCVGPLWYNYAMNASSSNAIQCVLLLD